MTADTSSGADGVQALLDHILREGRAQCELEQGRARALAREIIRDARMSSRRLVQTAIEAERRRIARQLAEAESKARAKIRRRRYREILQTLQAAPARLVVLLEEIWRNETARAAWIAGVIERGRTSFGTGRWRIAHPTDWDPAEWDELDDAEQRPGFEPDDHIVAGLRVGCGKATLDATVNGLLRRTRHVQALVLGELFADREGGSGDEVLF